MWYREHGGAVLATSIDKYCYITCRYLPPFFEHHSRIVYTQVENVLSNDEIRHRGVWGCLQHLAVTEGIEIHHNGDLPARTGLGSSSAFVVGLLNALYALKGQRRNKSQLAQEGIHVEQTILKENVGVQDQSTAAFGGLNLIRFHSDDRIEVEPLILSAERRKLLESHLQLYFTGFARTASEIAGEQIQNTPNRKAELFEMMQMVQEGADIVTNPGRSIEEFGSLLDHAWSLKKRMSSRISNSSIDAIYEQAKAAGALGGKLLGAGGGGFIVFFVPPERQTRFHQQMADFLRVPFQLSPQGSEVVLYEPTTPYDQRLSRERARVYAQHA